MKIAICDDEVQFINTTVALLEKWASKHHVDVTLYRFSNGDDLIRAHHTHCMDLIILDIIMPLLNGMDTAKELASGASIGSDHFPDLFPRICRGFL